MVGEKKLPARKPTSGGAIEAAQLAALLDKLINPANQSSCWKTARVPCFLETTRSDWIGGVPLVAERLSE